MLSLSEFLYLFLTLNLIVLVNVVILVIFWLARHLTRAYRHLYSISILTLAESRSRDRSTYPDLDLNVD